MINDIPGISTPLPWQNDVWAHLALQLKQSHLPHAILLSGPEFGGKARLAMALSRLLLCEVPVAGHNCGNCHACELSKSGNHGDFLYLAPEGTSRVIKVDQIRRFVEFVSKTASFGVRKVAIVSPAESLHRSAANALLKSLEEPSPDTHIILVCHRIQGLPATIRSRCHSLKLSMPGPEQSLPWLDQFTGVRADSEKALVLADGQVLLAAQLLREATIEQAVAIHAVLDTLVVGGGRVSDLAALMSEQPLEELLSQLNRFLCRQLRTMNPAALASKLGRQVFALLDEVVSLQRTVASGANPNRQLLIDSLSVRFETVLV